MKFCSEKLFHFFNWDLKFWARKVDIWDFDQKHYKSTKIVIFEFYSTEMVLKWSE